MTLTVARFDLDETVPIPNVERPQKRSAGGLPVGFPFLADVETGQVVEPVLLYLKDQFAQPGDFKAGRWTKRNSADAAAADLKDWWAKLTQLDIPWDVAEPVHLADHMTDMRTITSGRTGDFLSDSTVRRRCVTIIGFYRWAKDRGDVERIPDPDLAIRIVRQSQTQPGRSQAGPNGYAASEADPHPMSDEHATLIARAMGPLPSERTGVESSAIRLAFELGLETGMRIDEIGHLEVLEFEDFEFDEMRKYEVHTFRIVHTKGLIPREVFVPFWLMAEVRLYIDNERSDALAAASGLWLKSDAMQPRSLLLNPTTARAHTGKRMLAATIEAKFNEVQTRLAITKRVVKAGGTNEAKAVIVPKHVFHDTRHTRAVWYYQSLEQNGHQRPWVRVQTMLGHRNLQTTLGTYLKIVDQLAPEALAAVAAALHARRYASPGQHGI